MIEQFPLQIRSASELAPMQSSKWLKCQALLEVEEMQQLLDNLSETGYLYIFLTGCITKPKEGFVSKEKFLERYALYIDKLKSGQLPKNEEYRQWFSSVFTLAPKMLYAVSIGADQQLIRVAKPVVQLQAHSMHYSEIDGKFRPMIFGTESILWGIQFSYPQIYENMETKEIETVDLSPQFPNTLLYRNLQKWMRSHTIPTPFLVGEQLINVPIRIGRQCLKWINRHPQLIAKGIAVKED